MLEHLLMTSSFFDVECYKAIFIDIIAFSLNSTFHVFRHLLHIQLDVH